MKYFLKELLLFSIFPLIILISGFTLIRYISKKANFKTYSEVTEIYIGDSRITCALDDKLISNGKNLAAISEPFYFTFFKMVNFVETNPQVKTVYLGFSYHNLSDYCDEYISGEFSENITPKYFYILPVKNQLQVLRWNLKSFTVFTKNVAGFGKAILNNNDSLINMYSGYSNKFWRTVALPKSIDNCILYLFYFKGRLTNYSDLNIEYLQRIIDYCKSENIELKILQTPMHPDFYTQIPPEYINKYNEIIYASNLDVINFENAVFTDSSFTPDGSHMSVLGACQVTTELIRMNNRNDSIVNCRDIYK